MKWFAEKMISRKSKMHVTAALSKATKKGIAPRKTALSRSRIVYR
jgi:hypothetical protein